MTGPVASLVLISHERHALREAALKSIMTSIANTADPVPVIVLDSSREAAPVPAGVRLVHCTDKPSCVAKRRLAFELAETEWVIFLDDDCQVTPDGVDTMLKEIAVQESSRAAAMFVVTEFVGERTRWFEAALRSDLMAGFDYANFGGDDLMWGTTSLSAFRCSAVTQVGAFQADELPLPAGGEDVDACLRLRQAGWRLHGIPRTLALHTTETWNSFRKNGRRSRNYGAAESELMRLYPEYRRFGYENLLVSMAMGAAVWSLVNTGARSGRASLALSALGGWLVGEIQELRARHPEATPSQLGVQAAWSAVYELGRIETAFRRRRPSLAVQRFDWEATEPGESPFAIPPGIPGRLAVSLLAAGGLAAVFRARRRR